MKLHKQVTLITGTRKGIGKYLANYYLGQGHMVIGCSREPLDRTTENYRHFIADVSDELQVRQIFDFISSEHGRLDNLINNAGIASMNHSLLTSVSMFKKVLETNTLGAFIFCQEAARRLRGGCGLWSVRCLCLGCLSF